MAFSESDVTSKVAALLPKHTLLNRDEVPDPEQWMASIGDLVARVLLADQDALWSLVGKAAVRISKLATKITASLSDLELDIAAARTPDPDVADKTAEIRSILHRMLGAGKVPRAELATKLKVLTSAYAASSKLPSGKKYTGRDPAIARASLQEATDLVHADLVTLKDLCGFFVRAMDSFNIATLEDAANDQQVVSAVVALSDRSTGGDVGTQDALLEAVVIAALLTNELTKPVPDKPKVTGTAVVSEVVPAFVLGDAMPLSRPKSAYPTGLSTTLTVNGVSGSVTATASPTPTFSVGAADGFLVASETYVVATGDGATLDYTGTPFYLKTYTEPASVTVTTVIGAVTKTSVDTPAGATGSFAGAGFHANSEIVYATGRLKLQFTGNVDNLAGIFVTYTYHPIGLMQKMVAGADTGDFNGFKIFKDNTLKSVSAAQTTSLSTQTLLAAALDAVLAASTIDCAASGQEIVFTADNGGSCGQFMFPATSTAGVLNTGDGGPTWSTWPANLNDALLAVNETLGRVFGTDLYLEDLVVASVDAEMVVSVDANSVLPSEAVTVASASPTSVTVSDATNVSAASVVEFLDPIRCVIDVASKVGNVLTLSREYPFDLDSGTTLLASQLVSLRVSENFLRYTSSKSDNTSVINVSVAGIGELPINGTCGVVKSITFAASAGSQYIVRPGDYLYEASERTGKITGNAISANKYPVAYTKALTTAYPTSIDIRSRGGENFRSARTSISAALTVLDKDLDDFSTEMVAYGWSGANTVGYVRMIAAVPVFLTSVQTAADAYSFNLVVAVDGLVKFLREEKLSKVLQILSDLQFTELATATPEEISEEVSIESLVEDMIATLDQGDDFVETADGDTMLGDYLDRNVDGLAQLETTFKE